MNNLRYLLAFLAVLVLTNCANQLDLATYFTLQSDEIIVYEELRDYPEESEIAIIEHLSDAASSMLAFFNNSIHETEKLSAATKLTKAEALLRAKSGIVYMYPRYTIVDLNERGIYRIEKSLLDVLNNSIEAKEDYQLGDLYGRGTLITDSWTFCGFVPTQNWYTYKSGHWKFWGSDFRFLAEGEFEVKNDTINIDDECGDSKVIKISKLDQTDWTIDVTEDALKNDLVTRIERSEP